MDHGGMWDARRVLWQGSSVRSVQMCGRGLRDAAVDVRSAHRGHLHLAGTVRCSNVWLCPMCARRITRVRSDLLQSVLGTWESAWFGTLTIDQRDGEPLRARIRRLQAVWRSATKHMKRDFGGSWGAWKYVRVMELTRGRDDQGHPHFHVMVNDQQAAAALLDRWLASAKGASRKAQDLRQGDTGALVHYLTKEALGSHGKGRSHWRLLDEVLDGVPGALETWRMFEQAIRGSRQVVVSRGLYADAGVLDVTDEDAPEEPLETFVLDTVGKCAWKRLARRPSVLIAATAAWQAWRLDDVDEALMMVGAKRYSSGVHGPACECML